MSYEDIMYAAAIMEKVARETKNTRKVIAEYVGISNINHLAEYADVIACLWNRLLQKLLKTTT